VLVSCKPYRTSACALFNYTKDSNLNSPCRPVSFIVRLYCHPRQRRKLSSGPIVKYSGQLCTIHHIIDRNFELPIIRSCLQPLLVLFNYHFFSKHINVLQALRFIPFKRLSREELPLLNASIFQFYKNDFLYKDFKLLFLNTLFQKSI
jgi:hypothetical protein